MWTLCFLLFFFLFLFTPIVSAGVYANGDIYKTVFENSPIPTIILDYKLRVKGVSDYYSSIVKDIPDWKDKSFLRLLQNRLDPKSADTLFQKIVYARDSGETETAEVVDRRQQHFWNVIIKPCHIQPSMQRFWHTKKQNTIIMLQSTDLTGLVRQNERMQKSALSADIYHILVENIDDHAVFMLDPEGIVKTWNIGAKKIYQYEAESIIGQHVSIFFTETAKKENIPQQELQHALENRKRVCQDWRMREDGSTFYASINMTPLFEGETHIGFVKVIRDMTEEVANEKAMLKAHTDADKSKQNTAHELRSPLTSVLQGLSLLFEMDHTDEQDEIMTHVQESGQSLLRIVNDILDHGKMEARAMTLYETNVDMQRLTENHINSFALRTKIPLRLQMNRNIPQYLSVDVTRYLQIITNLVDNAVKYTKRGSINVFIDLMPNMNLEGRIGLHIRIQDTGIGIAEADLDNLFTPYSQVVSENQKGTGLGLAITKGCVELMRGTIWVESELHFGTTFHFTMECGIGFIPMEKRSLSIPSSLNDIDPLVRRVSMPNFDIKIVVVDDNNINRNFLRRRLLNANFVVDECKNGKAAVAYFQHLADQGIVSNHIVLMDVEMPPGMNGKDATRAIHKIPGMELVPIIAVTANDLASDSVDCLAAGMCDYITKPFSLDDLKTRIHFAKLALYHARKS